MAYLVYYRGEGRGFFAGKKECIILMDTDEEPTQDAIEGWAPQGFRHHATFEILGDTDCLPMEEVLTHTS